MARIISSFMNIKNDKRYGFMSQFGKVLTFLLIFFGISIFVMSMVSISSYKNLIKEDGIIEYISAFFWLLAAIMIALTIFLRIKNYYFLLTYFFLLIFFVVCGGEEISWGQRIFNFKGPSVIIEINKQQETNIHNIGSISVFANSFLLLYIVFFFVYPYKKINNKRIYDFVWQNNLPAIVHQTIMIAAITFIIWLMVGIRFGTLGFSPFTLWGYYTQMDDEIFEFLAAYSYFAFALLDFEFKYKNDRLIKLL